MAKSPPQPRTKPRPGRYVLRRSVGWVLAATLIGAVALGDHLGLFGRVPQPDYPRYHNRKATVTRVVDGDTLDVDLYDPVNDKDETRIRLWGVDTPETVKPNTPPQHFGPQATAATRRWCDGESVTLKLVKGDTRGKYKRLLAYIVLPDGDVLNEKLLRKGLAYADPRFEHPRRDEYLQLQARAVRDRRGLWKDVRPDDLPYYFQGRMPAPAATDAPPRDGASPAGDHGATAVPPSPRGEAGRDRSQASRGCSPAAG